MKISVFGNEDLGFDSLPIKILPELKKNFPEIEFAIEDPNELSEPTADQWIIIDTVKNLKNVREIRIGELKKTGSRVSLHDFDLSAHLLWLKKINPDLQIRIIGAPFSISEKEAVKKVTAVIATLFPKNGRHS